MNESVKQSILLISGALLVSVTSFGQAFSPIPMTYSAASAWQKVTIRPTVRVTRTSSENGRGAAAPTGSSTEFRPAFTGDFVTNRNHWRAGNAGDYSYQVGLGSYSIRKRNVRTEKTAYSYISLPSEINLNRAEVFTIKLDVLADSGQVATGGLLFGVNDSLNYCAFTTNSRGDVSIKRVANGETFSDYMSGEFFRPGVPVDKNRNRLMVKRRGEYLYFYVNDQEVRSSPYAFRMLSGNGIGLTSSGYWTSFQKLNVTVGL